MTTLPASLLPWTDRAGRLSALKLGMFLIVLAPALWLGLRGLGGMLGSKPLTAAIHDSGDWAVRFLLLSLLVTPLRRLANWPQLIQVRRMLGLAALAYVALHVTLYVAEQGWDLIKVASEIVLRLYLTIGFVALAGLVALGATSTDGAIRRLGAVRWNRLHAIVYGIAVLALIHFFLQRRLDVSEPVLMAGFFLWLMGWRWLNRRGLEGGFLALVGLALAVFAATMALEAAWYGVRNGAPVLSVLAANLDFGFTIRPAWWALAAGLCLALLSAAMQRIRPRPARAGRGAEGLAAG
jgi:sulfoxide reductase heme-binding subunit YedZ